MPHMQRSGSMSAGQTIVVVEQTRHPQRDTCGSLPHRPQGGRESGPGNASARPRNRPSSRLDTTESRRKDFKMEPKNMSPKILSAAYRPKPRREVGAAQRQAKYSRENPS